MIAQRDFLGRAAGLVGLLLYNWWIIALFDRRMLPGVNELFSDLEASGQPYAGLLSGLDVAAGLLILIALLLAGPAWGTSRPRDLLVVFASATVVGGLFPYVCAEGVDPACRHAEWSFALPWQHYVHVGSGIIEFAAATTAIVLLGRASVDTPVQPVAARLVRVLLVAYPLLAVVYLTDRFGALMEPVFFASFSAAVALVLFAPAEQREEAGSGRRWVPWPIRD